MSAHAGRRKLTPKTWIAATLLFALVSALVFWVAHGERGQRNADSRGARALPWRIPAPHLRSDVVDGTVLPDPTQPYRQRVAQMLEDVRFVRAAAETQHRESRAHFEPDDTPARLRRRVDDRATIVVDAPTPIDASWDFLVLDDGAQYHYEVVEVRGRVVHGRLRAEVRVDGVPQGARGVNMLRPTYLVPPPDPVRLAPSDYERLLSAYVTKLGWATNPAALAYVQNEVGAWESPQGRVASAMGNDDIVMVELERGAGPQFVAGTEVRLVRGRQFVGFARIVESRPDGMIARFATEFVGKGAPPSAGDSWSH